MLDKRRFDLNMHDERERQVEMISEYLANYIKLNAKIRDQEVYAAPTKEELLELDKIEIPRNGRDVKEVADELVDKVLSKSMIMQHPRFYSFVASAVSPYSLAGTILADIYNPNAGGFSLAPSAAVIEKKLVKWMGSLAGFPETCGGLFVSGGSMANMTGMIAARNKYLKEEEYPIGVAYLSDQTHSSVVKGLRLIGFRKDQIKVIETDDDFKLRPDLLVEEIEKDLKAGKKPFLIIGTIGTTNTGSIDPLEELADIKEKYHMWLHVDGAYGGSILLSDIYRNLAKGVERADSLSWDTHKWSMQTYSCSTLIARDKNDLLNAFTEHPEYLTDVINEEYNDGWDLGIEMSRPHRCLKFWFTLQAMGTDLLADVIDYSFFNAKLVEKELTKLKGWEITSKPCCGAITFRYVPEGMDDKQIDDFNGLISKAIIDSGFAYIVTSTIKNKRILRLCLINGNTTSEDVTETIAKLDEIAHELEHQILK